ncbi:hypothetical protein KPH14_003859 [Odynerus spinipes]|uniref:Uncharacterized protein n=1 Tax=Odynerus spinipes TaxID=1348599 RepID=A0AAD9RYX5_9HYME|nr:hypothetical protein KPH14_003859 [Odynerus spinipes]
MERLTIEGHRAYLSQERSVYSHYICHSIVRKLCTNPIDRGCLAVSTTTRDNTRRSSLLCFLLGRDTRGKLKCGVLVLSNKAEDREAGPPRRTKQRKK